MGKLLHASIKPKVVYERRLDGRQLDAATQKEEENIFTLAKSTLWRM
jgi:hypothetical protein